MAYLDILKIFGLHKTEKKAIKPTQNQPVRKEKPVQKELNISGTSEQTCFDILSSNYDSKLIKSISVVKNNVNCFTVLLSDEYSKSLLKGTILETYADSVALVFQVDKGSYKTSIYLNRNFIKENNIAITDTSVLKTGTEVSVSVGNVKIKLKKAKSPANVTVAKNVLEIVNDLNLTGINSKLIKLINDSKIKVEQEKENARILENFKSNKDNITDYLIDISDISSSKEITSEENGIICDFKIDNLSIGDKNSFRLDDNMCLIMKTISNAKVRILNDIPSAEIRVSIVEKHVTIAVFVPIIKFSSIDRNYLNKIEHTIAMILDNHITNRDGGFDYEDDYDYEF